jgi:hypothetical protein
MDLVSSDDPRFPNLWSKLWQRDPLQFPRFCPAETKAAKLYAAATAFDDVSCVAVEKSDPIAGLVLTVETRPDGSHALSAYGRPIYPAYDSTAEPKALRPASKLLHARMLEIWEASAARAISYRDYLSNGSVLPLTDRLLRSGATASLSFAQILELRYPFETLWRQASRSNRRGQRHAAKHLRFEVLEGPRAHTEHIEAFRQLHIRFRGREVRSQQAWHAILEVVERGQGFLVFGYLGDELVTADYLARSQRYCYAAIEARDATRAAHAWAHGSIWVAIQHAQRSGCQFFEAGLRVYPCQNADPQSSKFLGISNFNAGFGGDVRARVDLSGRLDVGH